MNQIVSMEEQDPPKQETAELLKHIEALPDPEGKLRTSIEFMRRALAQEGTPNFKGFWEVRKLCLPLFKAALPAPVRAQLWGEYIELTREGRRLKNLLDEETAFAVEQIDLAITALEKEVQAFHEDVETFLQQLPDIHFPQESATLEKRYAYYQHLQKQLNALNVSASHINSLRKELIRTEMRIRQKNQFFQRLSLLGDRVFPVRKELIREVSDAFKEDVDRFFETYFSEENFSPDEIRRSVFFFREEIKILQATAKILTLNTHAFSATREQLSHCWDKLKGMEKELKKEFAQQKQVSGENVEHVQQRIQAFVTDYAEGKYSLEEGFQEIEAISHWMREVELTRQHVRMLKEELSTACEPLEAKRRENEAARHQKQAEFEQVRREKIEQLKNALDVLSEKIATEGVDVLLVEFEECRKAFSSLSMMKMQRQQLERKLKSIRDLLAEKQEQALIDLSEDDRAALDNLSNILSQRKERRKEVKAQIEKYRKISGGSELDFEKAIRMQELLHSEKERLAKLDEGIAEIEKKIYELKKHG